MPPKTSLCPPRPNLSSQHLDLTVPAPSLNPKTPLASFPSPLDQLFSLRSRDTKPLRKPKHTNHLFVPPRRVGDHSSARTTVTRDDLFLLARDTCLAPGMRGLGSKIPIKVDWSTSAMCSHTLTAVAGEGDVKERHPRTRQSCSIVNMSERKTGVFVFGKKSKIESTFWL